MSLSENRDLSRRRNVAAEAVRAATQTPSIILPHTRTGNVGTMTPRTTAGGGDTVASVLRSAFPDERVLAAAEAEAGMKGWLIGADEHSGDAFPAFGPSVAYLMDGEAIVSAIQLPTLAETFSAAKGQGSTLNGRPLQVAPPRSTERTLVLSTHLEIAIPGIGEVVTRLAGWRMPSRRSGPLALLCYLATGRIDGFVERIAGGLELAAGQLLVREAGGVTATINGGGMSARNSVLAAASNAGLLEQMLRRLEVERA